MKAGYFIALIILGGISSLFAGTGINYQAVARNAAGQPIINTNVSLKFTVHSDSATGPVAYQETHHGNTSPQGIISVVIGGGMSITGNMDAIDWSGDKFLQVEYDPAGGNGFTDMGCTKMLGAAFSSYATTANLSLTANRALVADHALAANTALKADSSTNAAHAETASVATTALNANYATNALTANVALKSDSSTNSAHAATAAVATTAITATHATNADNATTATTATTALSSTGLSIFYAESLNNSSTTSSSMQDKVTLTLQAGTYLVTFSAMVASDSTTGVRYKFEGGGIDFNARPLVSGSSSEFTSVSNTIRVTVNNNTTLKLKYSRDSGGNSANIKNATISALPIN